jgi:DNA-binding transcriptional MerR regulator
MDFLFGQNLKDSRQQTSNQPQQNQQQQQQNQQQQQQRRQQQQQQQQQLQQQQQALKQARNGIDFIFGQQEENVPKHLFIGDDGVAQKPKILEL